MSSGSENIFFTNLSSDINFFPMWGGLKDQAITANQDASGFIPPSGRVFSDMFSLPLGGSPNPLTSVPYAGDNYFGINISGLGITTVAAETVPADVRLEYRIIINGKQVYMQVLPRNAARSSANEVIYAGDVIEWFFDHPVDVRAGTTLYAEIHCVRNSDDEDLGIFNVRQGDTVDPNTGLLRYQATVHNRLFEDKDLELISPYLKYKAMDFGVDSTGSSILLRDLSLGVDSLLIPHPINTLQAVADGTEIKIKVKGGAKVIIESLPVSAISIDGVFVNSVLNSAVTELNSLFTNGLSFASQGNPVTGLILSGNNLTLTLSDGVSYTADVTTLGVDTNNFVASGSLNGTDLTLTLEDSTTVIIDATNMVNGSTMTAKEDSWFISYGANANEPVGATSMGTTLVGGTQLRLQGPYYFGQKLERGAEFKWNIDSANQLRLGIWDGPEVATAYNASPAMTDASNWNTCFSYANGSGKFTSSSNTDVTTYNASGYSVTNGAPMSLRFGSDGHLTLLDLTGGAETIVGKTTIPLAVTEFNLQFGGFSGSAFPSGIIDTSSFLWEIVHDFANTEAGVVNGILDHTIIKSALSIEKGEKLMFMLDELGQGDYFGTNYTNAASGVATAEEQLDNEFKYETNEALNFTFGGTSDWDVNTNATHYFDNGAGVVGYRKGGASTIQGMFSLRFNDDGKLTVYSEDNNEKIATAKSDPAVGSSVHLYFGVRANRAYYSIPVISKQALSSGSQPVISFAPDVSDQTFTIEEGASFAATIALDAGSDIVNMYGESDAPSWAVLNQTTGEFLGTAPAFTGSSDDYVVNCKAANAIGGITNFTVTFTVTEVSYTNTKSLDFDGTSTWLQGNPVNMTALERATNGDGSAWTIGMWVKPSSSTATQTLLVYGAGDDSANGAITLSQSGGAHITLSYGTLSSRVVLLAMNSLTVGSWNHILVTFDGGTTGSVQADLSTYYSRFTIYVDGVAVSVVGSHLNNGYDGDISGADTSDNIYRIGRASNVHNSYADITINQAAIWGTDQTANVATIYNSGASQDLSLLATPPSHYYEVENSVTSIADLSGSATLVGYNFTSSDLVTDTP
jgi:hypothetical protein